MATTPKNVRVVQYAHRPRNSHWLESFKGAPTKSTAQPLSTTSGRSTSPRNASSHPVGIQKNKKAKTVLAPAKHSFEVLTACKNNGKPNSPVDTPGEKPSDDNDFALAKLKNDLAQREEARSQTTLIGRGPGVTLPTYKTGHQSSKYERGTVGIHDAGDRIFTDKQWRTHLEKKVKKDETFVPITTAAPNANPIYKRTPAPKLCTRTMEKLSTKNKVLANIQKSVEAQSVHRQKKMAASKWEDDEAPIWVHQLASGSSDQRFLGLRKQFAKESGRPLKDIHTGDAPFQNWMQAFSPRMKRIAFEFIDRKKFWFEF